MTDTTAKIRAKGLDSTGITEDIANNLYANKGKRVMAIVELHAVERHEKADGTRRVDLVLEQVEPATTDQVAEHLRELTRGLYAARAQADGQAAIDDSLTPDIGDAIKAGQQYAAHPFLPDDAAKDNPLCEVCARVQADPLHADRAALDDPFQIHDDTTYDDQADEAAYDDQEQPVPA